LSELALHELPIGSTPFEVKFDLRERCEGGGGKRTVISDFDCGKTPTQGSSDRREGSRWIDDCLALTFGSVPEVLTVPVHSNPSPTSVLPTANEIMWVLGSTGRLGVKEGGLDES
jgi:hypothetical protein